MNLYVICNLITNAGLAQAMGTDLFIHHMPDKVSEGIMLKEPLQGTAINHYLPGFLKGSFQAIVRSADYATGQTKSEALQAALELYDEIFNDTSGDFVMKMNYLRPRTLPVVYPRTPGNTIEWSITFDACYVLPV